MATSPGTGFDLDTVDKLLTTTRAVRKRLDFSRPVPREVILECLNLAIQAPTGTNAQTWRWLVITDPEKRAALGELYRNPVIDRSVPRREPNVPDTPQQRRSNESAMYLIEHITDVPALVIPCILDAGGAAGWQPSIYPAVWNFMLALRSRGLGSVITTIHLFRKAEAAALLGIPDDHVQACMLPVAYYTGDDFKPAVRRPVEEVVYFDQWGATAPSF
jgi:nitroreductase